MMKLWQSSHKMPGSQCACSELSASAALGALRVAGSQLWKRAGRGGTVQCASSKASPHRTVGRTRHRHRRRRRRRRQCSCPSILSRDARDANQHMCLPRHCSDFSASASMLRLTAGAGDAALHHLLTQPPLACNLFCCCCIHCARLHLLYIRCGHWGHLWYRRQHTAYKEEEDCTL